MPASAICVIGLGNMGAALAGALLAKGHPVTVWNRSAAKCLPLVAAGATAAGSAADGAATADLTIICVTDHVAVSAILRQDGMAEALRGKAMVQTSTVTAEQSFELAAWCGDNGVGYLEGSILGLPQDIADGSAIIVYGGARETLEPNRAALEALGSVQHVSEEIGSAVTFDRVYYAFAYGMMQSFMQGAALAHAKGFSIDAYCETVAKRLPSFVRKTWQFGEMIKTRDYGDVQAALELHAAAFADTLALCRELGVDDSLPAAVTGNFERAIKAGHGQDEIAALFEVMIP